ncbi:MAG: hypothetical protein U1E93_04700 [Alphaproteobacteria bacterium]
MPRGGWEYHAMMIPKSPKKPIRIWMVGEKDLHFDDPENIGTTGRWVNNRMVATVPKKKGYDCKYVFAMDAKHADNGVVRQTAPAALEWLWRTIHGRNLALPTKR